MTPQLRRSLQLLEMSGSELREFIEQELDENPVLERADSDDDDQSGNSKRLPARARPAKSSHRRSIEHLGLWPAVGTATSERIRADSQARKRKRQSEPGEGAAIHADGATAPNLNAHLLEQINIDLADPSERAVAMLLMEQLDESGYFTGDIEALSRRAGCTASRVEATLRRLQKFDPPGIFARDLAECLAQQLRERNRLTPAMTILLGQLNLLAKGDRKRMMRKCGVGADELSGMIAEIRTLNPRPASTFNTEAVAAIVPDVLVQQGSGGGWVIELQTDSWMKLLVKDGYVAQLRNSAKDKKTQDYVSERLAAANWLLRTLQRRNESILKVATAIVHHQDAFLRAGELQLRALTRRQLADAIGLHESTVSRVVANKFMSTPRGTYPIRFFFGGAIAKSATSPGQAPEAIKARIRGLVESEERGAILSDQQVAHLLGAQGFNIARRTVAKYRKSLRLPASIGRRRRASLQGA
jgi:RNA polymerase sigma-54 factor